MRHLISQNIVSRGFFVGTLAAILGAVSFSVSLPAFAVAPSQNPVKIFSDDFESGNFTKWIFCQEQITTSRVHAGSRALYYDGWPGCAATFSPSREVYFTYWWYIPSGFNFSFAGGKHFWRISSGDEGKYNRYGEIDTQTSGGSGISIIYFFNGHKAFFGAAPLPTGRWFKFELHTILNDPGVANGVTKVWINGVQHLNQSNVNLTATSNNLNILQLTTNYANCSGVCDWYMDDVEVWNGCPSGSSCNAAQSPGSLSSPTNLKVVP